MNSVWLSKKLHLLKRHSVIFFPESSSGGSWMLCSQGPWKQNFLCDFEMFSCENIANWYQVNERFFHLFSRDFNCKISWNKMPFGNYNFEVYLSQVVFHAPCYSPIINSWIFSPPAVVSKIKTNISEVWILVWQFFDFLFKVHGKT